MATAAFIHNFIQREQAASEQQLDAIDSTIARFIYEHPTVIKAIEAAGVVLGVTALAFLAPATAALPFWTRCFVRVVVAVAAVAAIAISAVAYVVLDIIVPPKHDMQDHAFTPASFGAGRLYYQGATPILELKSDDPYQAGLAHGYLMEPYINEITQPLHFAQEWLGMLPKAEDLPRVIREVKKKIPERYLRELQGVVDGFAKRSDEKWIPSRKITVDDLLLLHLMPDSIHFSPQNAEYFLRRDEQASGLACTVVIDKDKQEGITMARVMDWASYGKFGRLTCLINRKYTDGTLATAEIGFPGFCGSLTSMNEKGVSFAMNVCSGRTRDVRGMPAVFFNRLCSESADTADKVAKVAERMPPLGSYHLSVADSASARAFHFYQGESKKDAQSHVVRNFKEGDPLIVTNCQYRLDGTEHTHMHHSRERCAIIQKLFTQAKSQIPAATIEVGKLVEESLTLPYVNNSLSTHKVVMYPGSKRMKFATDNSYAGVATLHDVDTAPLFARAQL